MKPSERQLSLLSVLLLMLSGCSSTKPQYQVSVGNAHSQKAVQDVQLIIDGEPSEAFPLIAAAKEAASKPRSGTLPKELRVTWKDADGQQHDQQVEVSGPELDRFKGNLICEISKTNTLKLHAVPSLEEELSVIPWASPENWEGSIGIPGMESN